MNPTKLDLTGLKCPLPALMTRKALKTLSPGEVLEVHCTDPLVGDRYSESDSRDRRQGRDHRAHRASDHVLDRKNKSSD